MIDISLIVSDSLALAWSLVGTKETPPSSNRGLVIDAIQKEFKVQGLQYCVMFTLYCYIKALKMNNIIPDKLPRITNSQALYDYAKKNNCTVPDEKFIKAGDIIIFRHYTKQSGHAGIITSNYLTDKNGNHYCETIEGNTFPTTNGIQSAGDGIYRKKRNLNEADFKADDWYVRGFVDMEALLKKLYL